MFNLFSNKEEGTEPNPLKIHYAKTFLPGVVRDKRCGFVNGMASDEALAILTRAWTKFGQANLPKNQVIEPAGMEVEVFREGDQLLIVITLPAPSYVGEPYYVATVLGPSESGQWTEDELNSAPYRYFVATAADGGVEIEELVDEAFVSHGPSPKPDLFLFVEWVMNAAVRESSVVSVGSADEEMQAAIARARQTLPAAIERFVAGELEAFTVKVRVSDGQNAEHVWLSDTRYENGKFSGIIDAELQYLDGFKEGQVYEASIDDVSDWMHFNDGLMYGNYTLRVLLPRMPKEEAAKYAEHLAPLV